MTRKKWTKLRRQRPELFGWLPPFEKWNALEREQMAKIGKTEAITRLTTWMMTKDERYQEIGTFIGQHFKRLGYHPDPEILPLGSLGLAGQTNPLADWEQVAMDLKQEIPKVFPGDLY